MLLASQVDKVLRQILEWVQGLMGKKKVKYQPQKILKEQSSSLTRLMLIERDTPRAVRTWRSLPKNADHDILITCDHLFKVAGEKQVEKQNPNATHRLTVLQMSRIPGPKGSKKVTPLWSGEVNMVGSVAGGGGTNDPNRYAIVITDALARQLLGVPDDQIEWAWEVQNYAKQYVGTTGLSPSPRP